MVKWAALLLALVALDKAADHLEKTEAKLVSLEARIHALEQSKQCDLDRTGFHC